MSVTTEIQRINGGKNAIRALASQKNVNIPSTALIDSYASILGAQWPDCTFNVNYDGDKIRGKTMKWNQLVKNSLLKNNSEWTPSGSVIEINDGVLSSTATGRYGGAVQTFNPSLYKKHKLLFVCEGKIEQGDDDIHFGVCFNDGVSQADIPMPTQANEWQTLCVIRQISENSTSSFVTPIAKLQDNRDSGWTKRYMRFPFVFDLTNHNLEDITSTSDPRIPFLIQWAKDHPAYDTGSLVYSFYKGTKLGEYDYIDTTNNKLVLGGAEVDISQMSLTRSLFGSNYLFYGTNNDQETNTINVISADYQSAADITDIPDMSVTGNGGTGKTLWFRDDSCTTVEQFKTKNADKKVYFKLATPTEIDL